MISQFKKGIKQIVSDTIDLSAKFYLNKPDVVLSYGNSLGDDLLCTILARQLRRKGVQRIWMRSSFPELFYNNPDFERIITKPISRSKANYVDRFISQHKIPVITPTYTTYIPETDADIIPSKHIIQLMCDSVSADYPKDLKPYLFLSDEEKEKGKIAPNQICIQSTGKGAKNYIGNKDWITERFGEVSTLLSKTHTVVQVGSTTDELLPDVLDLRGKTSVRETASVLYNSQFFLGNVGFLMHLARSVNCKSVIIFGGREHPSQSGYEFNINLYSAVPCSPCWLRNTCPNNKICMSNIKTADVVQAITSITQ
jgi:ADP-heptose:LPS heptosyltransferase